MKRFIGIIICGSFFLLSMFFAFMVSSANDSNLMALNEHKAELMNKVETLDASVQAAEDEVVGAATGLNAKRVESDNAAASKMFRLIATWKDSSEYITARNTVISEYGFDPSDSFLMSFMPEIKPFPSSDGSDKYQIDVNGVNSEFANLNSYVVNITGDKYTYLGVVSIKSFDKTGGAVTGKLIAVYTVDSEGTISNASAYTIGAF
jgi:hypothetical protein